MTPVGWRMRPGELMRAEDHRVVPVDSYDDGGYWHDFGYDMGLRDLHRALASGYTNADALANFHYRAMDADRRLAQDARNSKANTLSSSLFLRPFTPGRAEAWARDRERMADELTNNPEYRTYINRLSPEALFEHTMPRKVTHELNRLDFERAARELDRLRQTGRQE